MRFYQVYAAMRTFSQRRQRGAIITSPYQQAATNFKTTKTIRRSAQHDRAAFFRGAPCSAAAMTNKNQLH